MSAPQTNVEKQEKNHRPPLVGMAAMVVFAIVLLIALVVYISARGNEPEETGATVDGRTGVVEEPVQQ